MVNVEPNKELLKVKNTMYFGFTAWELSMLVSGLVSGITLFLIMPFIYPLKVMVLTIVLGVFTAAGFIQINNMNLFRFAGKIIQFKRMNRPLVMKQDFKLKGEKLCQ